MTKRIVISTLVAAVASMIIGGLWSFFHLSGSPGPVFGIVFAVVFFFAVSIGKQPPP